MRSSPCLPSATLSSQTHLHVLIGGYFVLPAHTAKFVGLLFNRPLSVQDGGYHVPFAHRGLASGLQLDSYTSNLYDKLSIQSCAPQHQSASSDQRLGTFINALLLQSTKLARLLLWLLQSDCSRVPGICCLATGAHRKHVAGGNVDTLLPEASMLQLCSSAQWIHLQLQQWTALTIVGRPFLQANIFFHVYMPAPIG